MDIVEIRKKVLLVADPNSGYTQADFDKEFAGLVVFNDDYKIKFGFVNKSTNVDPEYATAGSSGFDLRADLVESVIIEPHKTAIIPTGLFFEIPDNFEIQIRPRSGIAAKNGVTVLNSPGTIDADYRGEIKVILVNHSDDRYMINHGDRIAQAVIASVISKNIVSLIKRDEISTETERGTGGFGHSGLK